MKQIKDCKHCDHTQGTVHHTGGATTSYVCCHCGRVRQEHVPPPEPISWKYAPIPDGHGPFIPRQTISFKGG